MAYDPSTPLSYYETPAHVAVPQSHMQSAQIVYQRMKDEADDKRAVEAEKAKRLLSYKLEPKAIHFKQDGDDQQKNIDRGINNINNGIDPKEENLEMEQRSLASKQQSDAVTSQLTPVTSKDNPLVADDNVLKAYQTELNQVDYKKRPENISDFNKKLKESPSSIYNTQSSNGKWLGGIKPQEVITSKKTQAGLTTFDTDLTTKGKFFIPTKEVIKDAQGKDMFDADGVTPLYKQKRITDVNEARTALDRMELSGAIPEQLIVLNADKAYKDPAINQQIEDELKQFSTTVLNPDGTVDENAVNNRREALKREAGKDFIANAMLNDEKASDITPKISTSVTKRSITDAELKARDGDKSPVTMTTSKTAENTIFNKQLGKTIAINTYNTTNLSVPTTTGQGNLRALLLPTGQDAYNNTSGDRAILKSDTNLIPVNFGSRIELYDEKSNTWRRFDVRTSDKRSLNDIIESSTTPIRILPEMTATAVKKDNTVPLSPDEEVQLNKLKATPKNQMGDDDNAKLAELTSRSNDTGDEYSFNPESTGSFEKVLGRGLKTYADIAKSKDVSEDVRNSAKAHLEAVRLANKKSDSFGVKTLSPEQAESQQKAKVAESESLMNTFNKITKESDQQKWLKDNGYELNEKKQLVKTSTPVAKPKEAEKTPTPKTKNNVSENQKVL